jgi:hypothetical protein
MSKREVNLFARGLEALPSAEDLYENWLDDAAAGDRAVYWTGNLSRDRLRFLHPNGQPAHKDIAVDECSFSATDALHLSELADRVALDAAAGLVTMTQRRVSEGVYQYLAVRSALQPEGVTP